MSERKTGWVRFTPRYVLAGLLAIVLISFSFPVVRVRASAALSVIADIIVDEKDLPPLEDRIYPASMPLEDAQASANFDILLPSWTPAGCTTNGKAEVVTLSNDAKDVSIYWGCDGHLIMLAQANLTIDTGLIALGDFQMVDVNGHEARLYSSASSSSQDVILEWIVDGVVYDLRGDIPAEDLLRMARSLQ